MAVNKAPEECNRKEVEIAKMLIMNSSKDVAKDDPLAYILGFEDAMNEFVKLSQREHQLDIEEGKVAGGSTIEQILDDGIVMMGESASTTLTTKAAPVIEDIEL